MTKKLITALVILLTLSNITGVLSPSQLKANVKSGLGLSDNDCKDCKGLISFQINSKKWSVCWAEMEDMSTEPVILNGKTYLLVKYIGDTVGWNYTYDQGKKQLTIVNWHKTITVVLTIGSNNALVNGKTVQIDKNVKVTPIVKSGRTLVPVKFLLDTFMLDYEWLPKTKEIVIEYYDPACFAPFSFKLNDLEDKPFDFTTMKGKIVFIDFSGSWCMPCYDAYPYIKKLHEEFGDKVEFITIMAYDEKVDAAREMEDVKLPWKVLYDPNNDVGKSIKVLGFPTFLYIDKAQFIRKKFLGFEESMLEIMKNAFNEMLK